MMRDRLRVLYLSNAFPPGVSKRFPSVSAAAHPQETRMAQALARLTDISTVGLLPGNACGQLEPKDDSIGLDHKLLLWEKKPELWHRWRGWRQLRHFYLEEVRQNGGPDVLLVRNLTPIFNYFVRWLRSQNLRPLIVLVLADSGLGQCVSISRRLRYYFKPMHFLEEKAAQWYDACLGFGIESQRHFEPRGVPWLWMPSAFNFYYEPPVAQLTGPIQFGYFGGLSENIGVPSMTRAFLAANIPGSLRVCGFGGFAKKLKQLAGEHPNLHFDGLKSQVECLAWAQQFDVLVNPRLPFAGVDNSFPSKLFEYAMTGKAILSTRACGVDKVLRDEGIYVETDDLEKSLCQKFREVSAMNRDELQQRGRAIRQRIITEYNWDAQANRMVEFLTEHVKARDKI